LRRAIVVVIVIIGAFARVLIRDSRVLIRDSKVINIVLLQDALYIMGVAIRHVGHIILTL
jgi:hypothetical protein